MPQPDVPADCEAIAAAVFTALADPTRRSILTELAAHGAATATDLAGRLPISRQAIAKHLGLLADAGLVLAEPGERRRVRFRLQPAPMAVAQSFLAALAETGIGNSTRCGGTSINQRPLETNRTHPTHWRNHEHRLVD